MSRDRKKITQQAPARSGIVLGLWPQGLRAATVQQDGLYACVTGEEDGNSGKVTSFPKSLHQEIVAQTSL